MNRPSSTEENQSKEVTEKKALEEELEVQKAFAILPDVLWEHLVTDVRLGYVNIRNCKEAAGL